jgi:hypothetical protein
MNPFMPKQGQIWRAAAANTPKLRRSMGGQNAKVQSFRPNKAFLEILGIKRQL